MPRMKNKIYSCEQQARDLLERLEHPRAQEFSAGDVVELANLIRENRALKLKIQVLELNALGPLTATAD